MSCAILIKNINRYCVYIYIYIKKRYVYVHNYIDTKISNNEMILIKNNKILKYCNYQDSLII